MKHLLQLTLIVLSALPAVTMASGNHAGGHHDGTAAIGKPGVPRNVSRTISVEMHDSMRFTPADVMVRQGETVRFVIRNKGMVKHEMGLGTQQDLLAHMEVMKRFPNMEHDEPGKVTLAPGAQGDIVWHFTQSGTVYFACLMPGHYEAGMKGAIQVTPTAKTARTP